MGGLTCEQCQQMLSSQLDDDEGGYDDRLMALHLEECAACRSWMDQAAAVTRLYRLAPASPARPLPPEILDAAPGPALARVSGALRAALALLGGAQVLVGTLQWLPAAQPEDGSADGAAHALLHLSHESASWNVALGATFLWIAVRRDRPAAVLPLLTTFLLMLAMLSGADLAAGRVSAGRLLVHGLVVAGYVIVLLLSRPAFALGGPPGGRRPHAVRWRLPAATRRPGPPAAESYAPAPGDRRPAA